MNKKDLIIAVLATFCLTSTLFMMLPTRSETPVGTYDPWIDLNEDGRINLLDAITQGNHFLTSGDSTKNVTITRHANVLAYSASNMNVSHGGWFNTGWISVDGYSKVTISLWNSASTNVYLLSSQHSLGDLEDTEFYVDQIPNIPNDFVKTYDVPNQEIQVYFLNQGAYDSHVWIDIYLIA